MWWVHGSDTCGLTAVRRDRYDRIVPFVLRPSCFCTKIRPNVPESFCHLLFSAFKVVFVSSLPLELLVMFLKGFTNQINFSVCEFQDRTGLVIPAPKLSFRKVSFSVVGDFG